MSFLNLPVEIRLQIYSQVFGNGVCRVDGGRQDAGPNNTRPSLLPTPTPHYDHQRRSAQLLRVCKTILNEARCILYQNTVFRSSCEAFAGRMPIQMTTDHPSFAYARHLEWSLHCDMLKRFDPQDVCITTEETRKLQTIKIDCQAESWRDSYCGQWQQRQAFVKGRQQVIDFARLLQDRMSTLKSRVALVEDTQYLSRGRVILRLHRGRYAVGPNELVVG